MKMLLTVAVSQVQLGCHYPCLLMNFNTFGVAAETNTSETSVEHPSKQCYISNALGSTQKHVWGKEKLWNMTTVMHKVIQDQILIMKNCLE